MWMRIERLAVGTALAVAVLLLAPARFAFGFALGDAELGSSINQPLRAWIPYRLGPGESLDAACVRLLPGPSFATANIPVTVDARLSLQSHAGKDYIAIESAEAITNRIVRLIVDVKCGKSIAITQEYMLLLSEPVRSAEPVASRPAPVPGDGKAAVSAIAKPPPAPAAASPLKAATPAATPPTPPPLAIVSPPKSPPAAAIPPQSPPPAASAPKLAPPAAGPPQSPQPAAASPPQMPVKPRGESVTQAKAGGAAVTPEPPKAPAVAQTPPPRQADKGQPVLRIEPARAAVKSGAGDVRDSCCFRLSYALIDRAPPSLPDAERERLRQEMRDRTSEQVPLSRVQALRDEIGELKKQLDASAKALENAPARAVPVYFTYAALAAIALMLASGAWFWLRQWAQRNPAAPGKLDFDFGDADKAAVNVPIAAQVATAVPVASEPAVVADVPAISEPPDDATISLRAEMRRTPAVPADDAAGAGVSTRLDYDFSQLAPEQSPAFHRVDIDISRAAPEFDYALRATEYKNAYIAARFPEIAAGNIVLDDHASVIEGARIFYQDDQDAAKAVELLRVALTTHPEHGGLWLAFFEVLWLERAAPEFADLAQRYVARGDGRADSHWPMIAKLGRDLDPGNELYRADGLPEIAESSPNWLSAELDMMGDVLALELRAQVIELHDTAHAAPGH